MALTWVIGTPGETYSQQALAFQSKYGPQTSGGQTRGSVKQTVKTVRGVTRATDAMVAGPITRLLGTQTGVNGFTLKSILTTAGTVDAYSRVVTIKSEDGTTLYIDAGTAYS